MKISSRVLRGITLLPGSLIKTFDEPPRFASTATPPTRSKTDIEKNSPFWPVLFDD
jgi:hypothetical protein